MPAVVSIILMVIPAIISIVIAGVFGLSDQTYRDKAKEKALGIYYQTGAAPNSATFLGKTVTLSPGELDTYHILEAQQAGVRKDKSDIEQTIVNTCITLLAKCGMDSRSVPVYKALKSQNLSSGSFISVVSDTSGGEGGNGYLSLFTNITGGGDGYVYYAVSNSSYAVVAGDSLVYSVYTPTGLPDNKVGGIEVELSDLTFGRNYGLVDQNGLSLNIADLTAYTGKWYYRTVSLTPIIGKTINFVDLVIEADAAGAYNGIFYKNIQIINNNAIKTLIWSPSYIWGFLELREGLVNTLLTNGGGANSITCATAAEADFAAYGKYLLRGALGSANLAAVNAGGVIGNYYYSKPAGASGCGFSDLVEVR